ncbi:hypothetical protein D3H55_05855 [Bacillus salacetis]|uniref:Coupling factor for flagellin transcription and translation n=1 Tax=Bacillus salacetis TaxID=2315464 RepID=A0A3A1R6D9_9BACI|nr:hypothetical protein D3H55_05855 [Bacillus salacetis]
MQTFLILISFILNIAALLAIVILYTRQNRLLEIEKQQGKTVKEMEDLISSYLLEMKEDNDRFIRQFEAVKESKTEDETEHRQEKVEKIRQAAAKVLQNESLPSEPDEDNDLHRSQSYMRLNAVKAYSLKNKNGQASNVADNSSELIHSDEDPLLAQVQSLQEKGYTVEEAARELGRGVTEIELLLKFRQNQK